MCKNNHLDHSKFTSIWLLGWLGLLAPSSGCRPEAKSPVEVAGPALPLERIAIVGASVSAGFGGSPFVDAFRQAVKTCPAEHGADPISAVQPAAGRIGEQGAAPISAAGETGPVPISAAGPIGTRPRPKRARRCTEVVESWANLMLFRDPIGETQLELGKAIELRASTVVAIDLLFWHVYNVRDVEPALAELDKVLATGAWILVGDVPRITTASELLLPKEAIPSQDVLDAANQRIAAWADRDRVLLVPLAEWTAPLRAGAEVELVPGQKVPAASLLALDGLHANPLGTWYLLDRLDHFIEQRLPGTPKDALVFRRPP